MSKPDKEITLMTLLAYEAPKESNELLKSYRIRPANNTADLEKRLAFLYTKVEDKKQLEKELADIHPHKKWLLLNTTPINTPEVITPTSPKEEKAIPIVINEPKEVSNEKQLESFKEELKQVFREELANNQPKSNADGNSQCPITCPCRNSQFSMLSGDETNNKQSKQPDIAIPYIGLIASVGLIGIVLISTLRMTKQ